MKVVLRQYHSLPPTPESCRSIPEPDKKKEKEKYTTIIAIVVAVASIAVSGGVVCLIRYRVRQNRIREYSSITTNQVEE